MKEVYLLVAPKLDYDESDEVRLAFSSKKKAADAKKLLEEWLQKARAEYNEVREIEDDDERYDALTDTERELNQRIGEPPFKWVFDYRDTGYYSKTDHNCVVVKKLTLDPLP